eukprot:794366-Lingulodinium_polyedra.AAC.1
MAGAAAARAAARGAAAAPRGRAARAAAPPRVRTSAGGTRAGAVLCRPSRSTAWPGASSAGATT